MNNEELRRITLSITTDNELRIYHREMVAYIKDRYAIIEIAKELNLYYNDDFEITSFRDAIKYINGIPGYNPPNEYITNEIDFENAVYAAGIDFHSLYWEELNL